MTALGEFRERLAYISLALALLATVGPWCWIWCRKGTAASAWGAAREDDDDKDSLPVRNVSTRFQAHLRGRKCWASALGFLLVFALLWLANSAPPYVMTITLSYVLCWAPCALILFCAWWRMGRRSGVTSGLIAIFLFSGGGFGVVYAMVLELLMITAWQIIFPDCDSTFLDVHRGSRFTYVEPISAECTALASLMWILTPGLIEESGKALLLFFRFRRKPEDLPEKCCFCLPASHGNSCGCWYKLATTPQHVFLCALAAGAGFEGLENMKYAFGNSKTFGNMAIASKRQELLYTALARALTSGMHMVWTGLIGQGLARRMFLPKERQPSLLMVVLPSMVAHGLFDYGLSGLAAVSYRVTKDEKEGADIISDDMAGDLELFFVALFLLASLGSVCLLCCLTGLRSCCCGPRSCGCGSGFLPKATEQAIAAASQREPLLDRGPRAEPARVS